MSSYTKRLLAKKILRSLNRRFFIDKDPSSVAKHVASIIHIREVAKKTDITGPQFQLKFRDAKEHFSKDFVNELKELTSQNWDTKSDVENKDLEQVHLTENAVRFRVNAEALSRRVLKCIVEEGDGYGYCCDLHSTPSQTILVEYSSPNIAKPFHAGHLRSTIIGNFVANLYESLGHSVVRINYLGDWGTQFGLLAVGFHRYGNMKDLQTNPMQHLFQVYVKINKDVEQEKGMNHNESIRSTYQQGLEAFTKMEEGDEQLLSLWRRFRDVSIQEYKRLYQRLDVKFTEYQGESMFQAKSRQFIDKLSRDGILKIDSEDGVGYVDMEICGQQNRSVLVKSDGSTLYLTRDVAAALDRQKQYKFDKMFYVVEAGQLIHFRHLIGVLRLLSVPWANNSDPEDIHVRFGRVEGMSTRKGHVVFLEDILDEAKLQMVQTIQSKETTKDIDNLDSVADVLGISGVIVQDLKQRRQINYKFNWDKVLSFKADSGVFLQYAHARLCSLERNCGLTVPSEIDPACLSDGDAQILILHLARYEEVVYETLNTLEPYHVVQYLFKLGHLINSAHKNLRVKDEVEDLAKARLLLFVCAKITLANGLKLLGIKPLHKM